jgi:8-oxo-dGTP pyrophosphatase MutT (NUDIX family)
MIKPWPKIHSKPLGDFRIFSIRSDQKISPRTEHPHDFFIIDCVNWVNVVALTDDQQLIMVEQFRHGTNTLELEIPGGTMDLKDLSPVHAGLRELREETGYEAGQAQILGEIFPNPAIMSNTCYTVLAQNCRLEHPLQLDSGEDLATRLVPVVQIPELVKTGQIRHSLVVVALYHFELWQRGIL